MQQVKLLTILFIALGLAMDAFAVSIASGVAIKQQRITHALRVALYFGVFQALMPLIGWLAGHSLREVIAGVDHWIAFGLLCFVGIKMIFEAFTTNVKVKRNNPLGFIRLLLLSIATSIDALAVGISLSLINVTLFVPALIIGMVTFSLSFIGVYVGDKLGHFFEKELEIIGGLVLIGIGIKTLLEHTI